MALEIPIASVSNHGNAGAPSFDKLRTKVESAAGFLRPVVSLSNQAR